MRVTYFNGNKLHLFVSCVEKEIIRKARELNPEGEFILERNGE
jgi:hypothetical protein